jgi:hypothetical protein
LQELDSVIDCLHTNFEKQWSDVSHVASTLAAVPQLLTSVQQLMEQIGEFFLCIKSNYGIFIELFFLFKDKPHTRKILITANSNYIVVQTVLNLNPLYFSEVSQPSSG